MKINYLISNRYKKIGWILLIPAAILGPVVLFGDYKPEVLDVTVFAFYVEGIFEDQKIATLIENNILDEILSILVIIGALLVAFSKEKHEDEYISKIRLESLVWATYVNYGILILTILFVYELSFFPVLVFNMFTILLFFIIRFEWKVWKLKKEIGHD